LALGGVRRNIGQYDQIDVVAVTDWNIPVYLLAVYAKAEKLNLTQKEKK
jgi:hypothetical protein